jgi:hypothetical protein
MRIFTPEVLRYWRFPGFFIDKINANELGLQGSLGVFVEDLGMKCLWLQGSLGLFVEDLGMK